MTEVLADVIFRMHLDHNQEQPTKANETLMLLSWREHMIQSGVPWQAVPLLYHEAVKVKAQTSGRGFMPTIGELLHEWQNALEAGYWEKQNAPEPAPHEPLENPPALGPGTTLGPGAAPLAGTINTDAAPEFAKAFARLATRGAAVTCHCPGDRWCHNGQQAARLIQDVWGSFWVCATGTCDFNINANALTPPESQPVEPPPPEAASAETRAYTDDELLDALQERCDFSPEKVGRQAALSFARHLEGIAAADLWTSALARSQWEVWSEAHSNEVYSREVNSNEVYSDEANSNREPNTTTDREPRPTNN